MNAETLNKFKNKTIDDLKEGITGLLVKVEGKWYVIMQYNWEDGCYRECEIYEASEFERKFAEGECDEF